MTPEWFFGSVATLAIAVGAFGAITDTPHGNTPAVTSAAKTPVSTPLGASESHGTPQKLQSSASALPTAPSVDQIEANAYLQGVVLGARLARQNVDADLEDLQRMALKIWAAHKKAQEQQKPSSPAP